MSAIDLDEYRSFIARKFDVRTELSEVSGYSVNPAMKAHQRTVLDFALRRQRSAAFLDTGLGKTLIELEFARIASDETGKPSLILAPLAVAAQIVREGRKFGIDARQVKGGAGFDDAIIVCNYERLHTLDPDGFGAVILDESSILKNLDGKTRKLLMDAFGETRFKLCATATPSPNDHTELGQHAEFLNVMRGQEMLSKWFVNDTSTASQTWRLKRHAVADFWAWVASWARCATLPSDLGGDDDGYILPNLDRRIHVVNADRTVGANEGDLFRMPEMSATSFHKEKRLTMDLRCSLAADLGSHDEPCLIWCESNAEAGRLEELIDDAVQVKGSQTPDQKEALIMGFVDGQFRVLITKPKIAGHGLNFQHCAHAIFASQSFSFEQHYQAVRRMHRFGQTKQVRIDVIVADTEASILSAIEAKAEKHAEMKRRMADAMRGAQTQTVRAVKFEMPKITFPKWLKTEG